MEAVASEIDLLFARLRKCESHIRLRTLQSCPEADLVNGLFVRLEDIEVKITHNSLSSVSEYISSLQGQLQDVEKRLECRTNRAGTLPSLPPSSLKIRVKQNLRELLSSLA